MAKQVSFIEFPHKKHHPYQKLGHIIVHDKDAKVSFHAFDLRHSGPRSRLGRFLTQLQKAGVDISAAKALNRHKTSDLKAPDDELTIVIAKRLYEALGKRTVFVKQSKFDASKTFISSKKEEAWDWSKPAARKYRYFKMAERILQENDHETSLRIVNLITGYA